MTSTPRQSCGLLRRAVLGGLGGGLAVVAGARSGAGQALDSEPQQHAFTTAVAYVVQFYPLWFSYHQSKYAAINRLAGPDRISPLYQIVVAIDDDTLYASTLLDLTAQPVILTIPRTNVAYSLLTLDPYGDIFESGIAAQAPGTYGLTGPRFAGSLPAGITRIAMPLDVSALIFRADKYAATGQNQVKDAQLFRKSLKAQTLTDYRVDPSGGGTLIVPEIAFAVPFKTTADALIARAPLIFLEQLQTAVASSNTPPLTPFEQALSNRFDKLLASRGRNKSALSAGAQTAHDFILERYLTNTGPTNWVHFTNIGDWGDHVIERASIAEFIQWGNGIGATAYYHAFSDEQGRPLDGTDPLGYVLRFGKDQLPEARRFWSLAAYTPRSIELVDNPLKKYVVASYTPGLVYNMDGSLAVYLARQLPPGVPLGNWLPIPEGAFNIMLRVYGPEGRVGENAYLPPGIQKR